MHIKADHVSFALMFVEALLSIQKEMHVLVLNKRRRMSIKKDTKWGNHENQDVSISPAEWICSVCQKSEITEICL